MVVRKLEFRNLFTKMFGNKKPTEGTKFELINTTSSAFYSWSGNIFDSDIVRAAVRPIANAVGKLNAKHIRGKDSLKINPAPWIKSILEKPNPYMTMQDFLCKMTFQRELDHNAFAYIKRDDFGYPVEIYPIPYSSVELFQSGENVFVKFRFWTGKFMTIFYTDLIHLRKDFYSNDFWGESGRTCLENIMEVITTTDQGIVNTIKNSAVIKWILMFKNVLKPEDQELQVRDFVKNYLTIDKKSGVAVSDPRYDLKQVEEKSYVPNAAQMKESIQRLYSYFGVNDMIVQNRYDEDIWNAFYESVIEPITIQMSNAFTNMFFTDRERSLGNKIIFETTNLAYASMETKLNLVQLVDRGALTPNEWRKVLNLAPIEGGDEPIRRLDTAVINSEQQFINGKKKESSKNSNTDNKQEVNDDVDQE